MSDRSRLSGEPNLFDLPLEPPTRSPTEAVAEEPGPQDPRRPLPGEDSPERDVEAVGLGPTASAEPRAASLARRWQAGLVDLGAHLAMAVLLGLGAWLLGARIGWGQAGGLTLFLTVFSFLYTVYSLAFWGQTPGMLLARVVARSDEHGALTFGQTALRWLGGLLTLATLGLASLLALFGGRSLSDRLSGTRSWELPRRRA